MTKEAVEGGFPCESKSGGDEQNGILVADPVASGAGDEANMLEAKDDMEFIIIICCIIMSDEGVTSDFGVACCRLWFVEGSGRRPVN